MRLDMRELEISQIIDIGIQVHSLLNTDGFTSIYNFQAKLGI